MDLKKEITEWIKCIVVSVIIALIIKTFIFNSTRVIGSSMLPTLHENDRLFSNKIVYLIGEPKKGDIVVIKAPDDPTKDYIKRVIALEGDTVDIKNGKVFINGDELKEDYISPDSYTEVYEKDSWTVPEGYVFVLGDNREPGASKDSRVFGVVKVESVKGKASLRYYPFNRMGKL